MQEDCGPMDEIHPQNSLIRFSGKALDETRRPRPNSLSLVFSNHMLAHTSHLQQFGSVRESFSSQRRDIHRAHRREKTELLKTNVEEKALSEIHVTEA